MKIKQLIAFLGGTCLLFSCSNEDMENPGSGDRTNGQPEIVFPMDFNWETSKTVALTLESKVATTVSIYSGSDCKAEDILVENLFLNKPVQVKFNTPAGNKEVYIQYKNAAGEKKTLVHQLNRKKSAADGNGSDVILPENNVWPTSESDAGFTFYHNTGVVMFEDNWPKKGDYDFNDVVVEYDLKVTECNDPSLYASQGYKENLTITMDIRAIGGGGPRTIGLVLEGLDKKYVDLANSGMIVQKKYSQGREEEVEQASDYKADADAQSGNLILTFNGLARVADYNHSGKFYQVTPGYIETGTTNPDHYMIRAKFTLMPDLSTDRAERLDAFRNFILDTKNQNFFIGVYNMTTPDNTEIHLSGYNPTYKFTDRYSEEAVEMEDGIPYRGKDGTIWGLKVPVGTNHVYEKESFFAGYPKFKSWMESRGQTDEDWYLFPEDKYIVKYW